MCRQRLVTVHQALKMTDLIVCPVLVIVHQARLIIGTPSKYFVLVQVQVIALVLDHALIRRIILAVARNPDHVPDHGPENDMEHDLDRVHGHEHHHLRDQGRKWPKFLQSLIVLR